jgi:small subunit ribosomal protein S6e
MPNFQFIVSDPVKRKAYKIEVDQTKATGIVGKRIGDKINGGIIGLAGYEIQLTGGTDKDGFPMHPKVHGPGRKKIILARPPGFHPKIKGQRRRKMVRGNTISPDIVQINCKVSKTGVKPIETLLPKKEKEEAKPEEKSEKPKEEKKPEKKEEKPKEKKTEKKEEEKPKSKEKPKKEQPKKQQKPPEKKEKGEEVRKESKP